MASRDGFLFALVYGLAALQLLGVATAADGPHPPFNLKCEKRSVGLNENQVAKLLSTNKEIGKQHIFATDVANPLFSWSLRHSSRGASQQAFQVIVAAEDTSFQEITWDSGFVHSKNTSIRYGGNALKNGTLYYWKVRWWDQNGHSAESKETGHFLAVIIDWSCASWIAAPKSVKTAPVIYTPFQIDPAPLGKALVYVSGLGFYKIAVNGEDINSKYDPPIALTPGWTNYEMRVPYDIYDITKELRNSPTPHPTVGVSLGLAWRDKAAYSPKDAPPSLPDDEPRVARIIISITYKNGTGFSICSDQNWMSDVTPFVADSVYNGEWYNAQMVHSEPTPQAIHTIVVNGPSGKMYLPPIEPITEVGVEKPVQIYTLKSNSSKQIVDFGHNSAGVCRINVESIPAESVVEIRHAEVPMHPPYGEVDGSLYYANLRSARQLDQYTSSRKEDVYQPSFTYHGFRYAEVTGYPRNLMESDIQKILINTNVKRNAKTNFSISLFNEIQENVVRGQLSNLMSVPTDCAQRDERLGWMGDAGLSSDSMALNFDMSTFFPHFVQLIADEFFNSTITDVVPFYRYGSRPSDPSWGAAFPQIIWALYKYYNDKDTLESNFNDVANYLSHMYTYDVQSTGVEHFYAYYGDWVPPPPSSKVNNSFTSAFSYMNNLKQAIELATVTGNTTIGPILQTYLSSIVGQVNSKFLSKNSTGQYLDGTQVTYVFPLALDIVPKDIEEDFIKAFLTQLNGPDSMHIRGGIIGTKYILPLLTEMEQHDLAVEIVEQLDYPSWGYMIHNPFEPATAIWELWDAWKEGPGMNSRNHHMFSSVSAWLVHGAAGLNIPEGSYGFEKIHFHPARALGLSHASVSLEHPKSIEFSWQRHGSIQCAKAPENQSPLNPTLPRHSGLELSCGEKGGNISEVLFASFGNPTGHCGNYKIGSCHVSSSREIVEKLCLGRTDCKVPTGLDFWVDTECSVDQAQWLVVSVQCQQSAEKDYKYSAIQVDLSVPVGSTGVVFLPAHGKAQPKVWEGVNMVWSDGRAVEDVVGVTASKWLQETDTVQIELDSGTYSFTIRGETPEISCVKGTDYEKLTLKCSNSADVITSIDWASYGTPGACYSRTVGECHAGSSQWTVEKECIGKHSCDVFISQETFGRLDCLMVGQTGRLVVEYACAARDNY